MSGARGESEATLVLFGPRTRLGAAVLELAQPQHRVVRVARDEAEARTLERNSERGSVWNLESRAGPNLAEVGPVWILGCGMGLLHPVTPRVPEHIEWVRRDLGGLERILGAARDREVHGLLVSSVVALATPPRRAWYGGLKNVLEAGFARGIESHPRARMSVYHPGRLVGRRGTQGAASWMATSYRRLAGELLARAPGPARRVVRGLDARAWLLARALATGLSACPGKAGEAPDRG